MTTMTRSFLSLASSTVSTALLTLATLAAACSSSTSGGNGSGGGFKGSLADGGTIALCAQAPGGSCTTKLGCTDSIGTTSDLSTLQSGCTSGGGTWSTSACSHSGDSGGCCSAVGVTSAQTSWSASETQAQCWQLGGEWVQP
jgi:hypothetical protein